MPRRVMILATLLVSTSMLALAQPAGATTYCVNVPDPTCTSTPTVQAALTAAAADPEPSSIVEVGSGLAPENNLSYPVPSHPGHPVEVVGSPDAPPILTHASGDPHPVIGCTSGALTLRDLVVRAPSGSTFPGITGAGTCGLTLDHVTVDTTLGTGNAVELLGGGTIRNSDVSAAPAAGVPVAVYVNSGAATTITDSSISGGKSLVDVGSGVLTAHRLKITSTGTGNAAVTAQAVTGNVTLSIDDTLIRTLDASQALFATSSGSSGNIASLVARQLTAVANDGTAALPFHVASTGGPAMITAYNTVASGYTQGVRLDGGGAGVSITLHHTAMTAPGVPSAKSGIATYTHSDDVVDIATHPPLFVDPAGGDFHLGSGSVLIDEAAGTLEAGESTTDVLGHPRVVNGKRDLGAIEHQPAVGTATVATTAKIGSLITFAGSATGDAGTPLVSWDFGDGLGADGASTSHSYAQPGTYHWQMLMDDGTTLSATVAGTVVVSAEAPVAVTSVPDQISAVGALLHGTVDPHGGPTTYYFEYGLSTTYGAQTPPVSAGAGTSPVAVSAELTGLASDRVYHERLVALHGAVVAYGADQTFQTAVAPVQKTTKTTLAAGTRCRVPHLVGKTLRQAHSLLVHAHCQLGNVTHRHVKRHRNRVLRQARVAGRSYARNTAVAITVGRA